MPETGVTVIEAVVLNPQPSTHPSKKQHSDWKAE